MKFTYTNFRGNILGGFNAEYAVQHQVSSGATNEERIDALCCIVGRLIETLPPDKAAEVLGPGWSVDNER